MLIVLVFGLTNHIASMSKAVISMIVDVEIKAYM